MAARLHRGARRPPVIMAAIRTPPELNSMIETNPIRARIADLQARVASLRGYL
jgi:hypothetical protein